MAPTSRRGSKATRKASKPRRTDYNKKKKLAKPKISNQRAEALMEDLPSNSSTISSDHHPFSKIHGFDVVEGVDEVDDDISTTITSPCSTPKAQRFRIPEIHTCPPAPKKQRLISNCSLRRTPIAFFAPPDLELFFFFAFRDIPI